MICLFFLSLSLSLSLAVLVVVVVIMSRMVRMIVVMLVVVMFVIVIVGLRIVAPRRQGSRKRHDLFQNWYLTSNVRRTTKHYWWGWRCS